MLLPKAISELQHSDIEAFCTTFRENVRVEYKGTFDDNVKHKLPQILSSFANSYGGVLVIGVSAKNGTAEPPIQGTIFKDPEPRLTVENICRANIVPELSVYSALVPSRIDGHGFLVVQVNESPKAPHAIENSTRVYIRTGDSAHPMRLADIPLLERLLLRRREVFGRWTEFFNESAALAGPAGISLDEPTLDIQIGPLYPTDRIIAREQIFSFLTQYQLQLGSGLVHAKLLRYPTGAILVRTDSTTQYINVGEFGIIHYSEPLRNTEFVKRGPAGGPLPTDTLVYPFWWVVSPILKALDLAASLFRSFAVTCEIRIEGVLANVSKRPFTLAWDNVWPTLPVSTIARTVPAFVTYSSERLADAAGELAVELIYQLRWPFGTEQPQSRDEIRLIVAKVRKSSPR